MERTVYLILLLSSAQLEVRCLECYVCDNCANVKLKEIQTCGPTATSRPSTSSTTTMKPLSSSTGAAEILTTFSVPTTTDPITIVTKTATESTSSPTTITTDSITTVTTTTETPFTSMSSTTEAITNSTTTATTPFTYSATFAKESTTAATILTIEPINTSTVTTVSTSTTQNTTEPEILSTTLTEPGISTLATANENTTTITEPTIPISFTAPTATSAEPTLTTTGILTFTGSNPDPLSTFTTTSTETTNQRTDTVSEPIVSYLITTKLPLTVTSFISDLGPLASFTGTGHSVQTISSVPKIAEPLSSFTATEPVVQIISSEPTITAPIASMSTESTRRSNISVAYPQTTSANIAKPVLDTNAPYDIRRIRSVPQDCLCTDEKCDCPTTHQISKRYAVRGLALSKNVVKYVCVVDKYKINETEVTKRGCAIIEEDEQTSCVNSGFGANCKLCDTDQCNSGAILQSSILMMFTFYLMHSV